MVDGDRLGDAGFKYLGVPYSQMDCQAFVEQCLRDCGCNKNLAGSNAWYREVYNHGVCLTPEECVRQLGTVPKGAFLFILKHDGGEPEKYKPDGLGNASHIGICTGKRGEGAIHSSSSRGCVAESKFKNKTINGGWNMVGLWNQVAYDYTNGSKETTMPADDPAFPTLRRGDRGEYVTLLQTKLIQLGYNCGAAGADGIFGRGTEEAVRAFQTNHELETDGICGRKTWEAINNAAADAMSLYTVIIPHLMKAQAESIKAQYAGASVVEERG